MKWIYDKYYVVQFSYYHQLWEFNGVPQEAFDEWFRRRIREGAKEIREISREDYVKANEYQKKKLLNQNKTSWKQ